MMIIGCYTMDLYCDRDGGDYGAGCQHKYKYYTGGPTAQILGSSEASCLKQARANGWRISPDKIMCICPGCVKDGAKFQVHTSNPGERDDRMA